MVWFCAYRTRLYYISAQTNLPPTDFKMQLQFRPSSLRVTARSETPFILPLVPCNVPFLALRSAGVVSTSPCVLPCKRDVVRVRVLAQDAVVEAPRLYQAPGQGVSQVGSYLGGPPTTARLRVFLASDRPLGCFIITFLNAYLPH